MSISHKLAVMALVAFASVTLRGEETQFERRLVPIAVSSVAGAYTTQWASQIFGVNDRPSIRVYGFLEVGLIFPSPAGVIWSQAFVDSRAGEPPGCIIYVPRDDAAAVHMTVRLDQTGAGSADAVTLPVVQESEFRESSLNFLALRTSSRERAHLRIYSLDLQASAVDVLVRVVAKNDRFEWKEAHRSIVSLDVRQITVSSPYGFSGPSRPWAAEIALAPILDQVLQASREYSVIVTPLTPGTRIWAFVSEVDSDTQRVQVILPQ